MTVSGLLIILVPLALAIVLTFLRHAGEPNTTNSFYVANRRVGTLMVGVSVASAWIWTVALYVLPQKMYEVGIVAAVPLIFVNALCLVLLGSLVPRVRAICGDRQVTLPQFARMRDGKRTESVFAAGVLGVQVYSVITHLLGATLLLQFIPGGFDKPTLILVLAGCFFAVAAMRGLQSSIVADVVKYTAVFGVILVAFIVTRKSGGLPVLEGGIAGLRAPGTGLVDAKTLWQFVIPTCAALLSAVAMDDQLYQRGFAARFNPRGAYMLGGLLFLVIAIGMGMLGLLAANESLGVLVGKEQHQLVNFLTIQQLLPNFPMYLVAAVFMTSLIASGAAALHAAGNVGAKNVVQMCRPTLSEGNMVLVARITMIVTLAVGIFIPLANAGVFEPWVSSKIDIFDLWIGWGMFRAILFFPIIALITMRKEVVPSVFAWIVIGFLVTFASFDYFLRHGSTMPEAAGTAILFAWAATLTCWLVRVAKARLAREEFA